MATKPFAVIELRGAGGEPVDLWRTLVSHGFAGLPPLVLDEEERTLELTLAVDGGGVRTVRVAQGRSRTAELSVTGRAPSAADRRRLVERIEHVLRLDEDLSGFYAVLDGDPDLAWVRGGAGRMLRSPTVFEDVVKTICTTNCTWSATERMVGALVDHLGEAADDGKRAFPTPEAMAAADESFYKDVARAGYRGAYLRSLAASVAGGAVDLEVLSATSPAGLPDNEVAARLLGLPGVGPYAAAHIMMLLGRYSRLILDAWTRPKYARLTRARKQPTDSAIERRFRRYGDYAGLAFWLFLTRDWVEDDAGAA